MSLHRVVVLDPCISAHTSPDLCDAKPDSLAYILLKLSSVHKLPQMASSLTEFYPSRKMEEITNRHKLDRKRMSYPMQQRLPSPSSPCDSVSPPLKHHSRNKSVLFLLDKNQLYEASPLLTPKDEDDDDDTNYDLAHTAEAESPELLQLDFKKRLDENPDYIALTSTLSMLHRTKSAVTNEITALQRLKKQTETASKLDLVAFYVNLICNRKQLPVQHKVVRAPTVQWDRYHLEMASASLSDDTTNECNKKQLFKTLSMFQRSP